MDDLTIGTVAKRAGIRPSAIRYYESAGLLPAPRRVHGQRRYSADVLTDLAVIRAAQDVGFTVSEIRQLFHDFPAEANASARWHVLARRKITELNERISHAERMRTTLTESLSCGCVTFGECALIPNRTA